MDRPDLLSARSRLGHVERTQIALIRRTFEPGRIDHAIRFLQKHVGANWIHFATRHLKQAHGLERLPVLKAQQSYICVANHRSFFDLYVVTSHLIHTGLLHHRIVFPVRSSFFYDQPLGFVVNGAMSFFAMYPPIFREKKQLPLNVPSLDELAWLLRRGGTFAGLHPEGTRKKDDDPYTLLPAQRGMGRVIHEAGVPVLPAFVNGLLQDDLARQVRGNFDGTGRTVHIVFGAPVDFGDLLDRPRSPRVHRAVAERAVAAISELGQEEKRIREAEDRRA